MYGKISAIHKAGTDIFYTYDASGNRISKTVGNKTTWYVRDASGNVMGVYEKGGTNNEGHLTLTELHMYGSSRLGVYNTKTDVSPSAVQPDITIFERGDKFFELTNHLGNVLVTITDKRNQHVTNGALDYYEADIATATDYYPFGMGLVGRKFEATSTSKYRYSVNGQEKESDLNENITTAEYWEYDSRIGRRWNPDIIVKPWESPYLAFSGNPILCVDKNGADTTLPKIDGGTADVSTFTTFDGTTQNLKGCGTSVTPTAGTLNTFTTGGNNFQSEFNCSTGAFIGYFTTDGKHLSYLDYSSQLAASNNERTGSLTWPGALIWPGTGSATRTIAQPSPWSILTTGAGIGTSYGLTHSDKIQDMCIGICRFFGADVPIVAPIAAPTPPMPITLYRGVYFDHPDYPNAILGIAEPAGGDATPEQHAGGNYHSNFTSWTMFRCVADWHANKKGPGGIVLTKEFLPGQFIPNFTFHAEEGEFLVPGRVTGAIPSGPLGPGYPTGY